MKLACQDQGSCAFPRRSPMPCWRGPTYAVCQNLFTSIKKFDTTYTCKVDLDVVSVAPLEIPFFFPGSLRVSSRIYFCTEFEQKKFAVR